MDDRRKKLLLIKCSNKRRINNIQNRIMCQAPVVSPQSHTIIFGFSESIRTLYHLLLKPPNRLGIILYSVPET